MTLAYVLYKQREDSPTPTEFFGVCLDKSKAKSIVKEHNRYIHNSLRLQKEHEKVVTTWYNNLHNAVKDYANTQYVKTLPEKPKYRHVPNCDFSTIPEKEHARIKESIRINTEYNDALTKTYVEQIELYRRYMDMSKRQAIEQTIDQFKITYMANNPKPTLPEGVDSECTAEDLLLLKEVEITE